MSLGAGSIYPSKAGKLYAWGSAKGNHLPGAQSLTSLMADLLSGHKQNFFI